VYYVTSMAERERNCLLCFLPFEAKSVCVFGSFMVKLLVFKELSHCVGVCIGAAVGLYVVVR
jgi:hypothetical protein